VIKSPSIYIQVEVDEVRKAMGLPALAKVVVEVDNV